MAFFDTVFHDDTKCFIAWRILIFGSGLLLSAVLIQRRTTFLSVMGFEVSYYTLVHWLKNRRCIWRHENQVDVREVLDFSVSREIVNQKGNLSALSAKG